MKNVEKILNRIGFGQAQFIYKKDEFKVILDEYLTCKTPEKTLFKIEVSVTPNIILALFQEYNIVNQDTLDEMWEEDFLETLDY